jgi:hypothetical protein
MADYLFFVNIMHFMGKSMYMWRVAEVATGHIQSGFGGKSQNRTAAIAGVKKAAADAPKSKWGGIEGNGPPGWSVPAQDHEDFKKAFDQGLASKKDAPEPEPAPPAEAPKTPDPPPPPPPPLPPPAGTGAGSVAAPDVVDTMSSFAGTPPITPNKSGLPISKSKTTKKARDLSGMRQDRREKYDSLTELEKAEKKINGVFGNKRMQAMVKREDTSSEKIVSRGTDNNAFIIIGNDRVGKPHTGYGGKGHTQCDAIDIVVGMGGHSPREVDNSEKDIITNPNFFLDSARIYISQKTDVDKNFGIGEFGRAEENEQDDKDDNELGKHGAKSAVVAKADNLRFIGRESIRLVTGTDAQNSQGGDVLAKSGIEIVAMNDTTTLQPMVLGDNLITLLSMILDQIAAIGKIGHGAAKYQMKMNQATQQHIHISPFFGLPTLPSQVTQAGGIKCDIEIASKTELSTLKSLTNLQGIKHNYLTESGENFILSRLNKVN